MSRILEKINRAIDLALNNSESEEARNAAVKACKLIREHKISLGVDPLKEKAALNGASSMFGVAVAKVSLKNRVLQFIEDNDGATCDEIEEALGVSHQSASARVHELMKENIVEGKKERRTRTGRWATIWTKAS